MLEVSVGKCVKASEFMTSSDAASGVMNDLKELSDGLGDFHGNLRSHMQLQSQQSNRYGR